MAKIVIYQKPTCTTCRKVYRILKDSGVDVKSVNYFVQPIPKSKMKELLRKMGIPARALLRTKEKFYTKLRLGERELSESEILNLLTRYPDLIQRPIVEKGRKAILARPAERIRDLLP
jgi:arsenate reductase